MVSNRFDNFDFSSYFGPVINFQFLDYHGASEFSMKKALNEPNGREELIKMVVTTL